MFFLIRSAFCIGIVALILPGSGTLSTTHDLATAMQHAASAGLQRYCTQHADCVETGARMAGWLLAAQGSPGTPTRRSPASVSTLDGADLIPAWSGPKPQPRG